MPSFSAPGPDEFDLVYCELLLGALAPVTSNDRSGHRPKSETRPRGRFDGMATLNDVERDISVPDCSMDVRATQIITNGWCPAVTGLKAFLLTLVRANSYLGQSSGKRAIWPRS